MITDTEVKMKGVIALTESLGQVRGRKIDRLNPKDTNRLTTPKWQRTLWAGSTVKRKISQKAMKGSKRFGQVRYIFK